jgi:hypothetical protein
MHQVAPASVVGKEIAVIAKAQPLQDRLGLCLRLFGR